MKAGFSRLFFALFGMKLFLPLLAFLILLTANIAFSQAPETIASDRPGNAYTSTVVGAGVFQGQNGLEYGHANSKFQLIDLFGNRTDAETIFESAAFTNYFRYGIGKNNEINAVIDYRYSQSRFQNSIANLSNYNSGISNISLGFRQNFLKEKGNAPALGILVNANFNGLLNDYRNSNPDGFLMIIAQKQLSNLFSFTTNLGFNYGDFINGSEIVNSYLYTMNLGYSITPKLSGYIEGYGFIADGKIVDYYDTGFGYLINKDLQLDLYGGIYTEENYFEYFVTFGVSFRVGAI